MYNYLCHVTYNLAHLAPIEQINIIKISLDNAQSMIFILSFLLNSYTSEHIIVQVNIYFVDIKLGKESEFLLEINNLFDQYNVFVKNVL